MRRWGILLIFVLLVPTPAGAGAAAVEPSDPREDKQRVDAELAQTGALLEAVSAQVQQAVTRLAEIKRELPLAKDRAARARGTVAAAETVVVSHQARAETARGAWQRASGRYEKAVDGVREGRERLGRFADMTHRGGLIAQFNAMISAAGPAELAQRYSYSKKIAEAKKGAVDRLVGALRDAKHLSNEATLARNAADAALAEAGAAMAAAQAAKEAAERTQHELAALAAQQEDAAARAEAHRAEVLERHAELQRESERIAAELLSGAAGPSLRPGARLLMPVRGWKSSDFGMRYDPYYHVWQLHSGIDIAAGGGQPIYAAADGQVASAGWRGGYGNYTCLNHGYYEGQRLSTCYAHQSKILAGVGQWVSRGRLIGRVGTTGASTGNHLHFEVRLDGAPVEPENWLPSCLC